MTPKVVTCPDVDKVRGRIRTSFWAFQFKHFQSTSKPWIYKNKKQKTTKSADFLEISI